MWPLALLHFVSPSSFTLLVIQDLALAGIVLVTYLWCLEIIATHWPRPSWQQFLGTLSVLGLLLINPFIYETASFDFHFQALATLCLLVAARDLWRGHHLTGIIFAAVTLTFGIPIALYVVGVGIAVVLLRGHLRAGLVVVAMGLCWLVLFGSLHFDIGSHVASHYGYLIGEPNAHDLGALSLAVGLLAHPGTALHTLVKRTGQIAIFIESGGTLGIVSPWGLLMSATVLLPNALNANPAFIGDAAAFQSLAAIPFMVVGSLMVVIRIAKSRLGRPAALVAAVLVVIPATLVATAILPGLVASWPVMSATNAHVLSRVDKVIPASAEVIASDDLVGRLSARRFAYPQVYNDQVFPVHSREVVFVFYNEQNWTTDVIKSFHAKFIAGNPDIAVLLWYPPKGTTTVAIAPPAF